MEKFNTLATSLVTIMRSFGENIESIKVDVSETRGEVEAIKKDIGDIKAMLERLMVSAPQPIEEPATVEEDIEEQPSDVENIEAPVEDAIPDAPAPISEASEPYDWRKDIGEEAPEPIPAAPAPIEAPKPAVSSEGEIRARFDALSTVQRRGIARAFLLTIKPALSQDILRNPSNLSWEFCESVDTNNIWADYVENALK